MKKYGLAMIALLVSGAAFAEEAGDAEAGKKVFAKCMACHSIGEDAKNKVGPVLTGVIGRQPGTYPGFAYSAAMKKYGEEHEAWTPELLLPYLKAPREVVPGTRMAFAGLQSEKDEADLIAYLLTFSPDYVPEEKAAAPAQ